MTNYTKEHFIYVITKNKYRMKGTIYKLSIYIGKCAFLNLSPFILIVSTVEVQWFLFQRHKFKLLLSLLFIF